MIRLSTTLRMESSSENMETVSENVMKEILSISDRYILRYKDNYLKQGQAYGNDAMWQSDSDICQILLGSDQK